MAPRVGLDRQTVIAAAADIADAEGLEALTLARLAKELGVRYQSLYSHVSSLPELHRQLQLRYLAGLGDATRRAAMGRSGRDALLAIAEAHLEYDLAHPGLTAVHWTRGVEDLGVEEYDRSGEAIVAVLRTYGLTGEELVHWRRSLAIMMFGFSSLQLAGLLCEGPDPNVTYRLMVDAMADVLEARRTRALPSRAPKPAAPRRRGRKPVTERA